MFLEKLCFGHSVFNYNVFTNICVALRHSVFNNNVFMNTLFFDKVLSIREAVKKLFFRNNVNFMAKNNGHKNSNKV